MRYILRYTQDLTPVRASDNADSLKGRNDYKVHILDSHTDKVIWQSSKSERYGTLGIA